MDRKELIKCFNSIPEDIRVEVFGEYNGTGSIEIQAWCGKGLCRGWKDYIDKGYTPEEVIEKYSHDIWKDIAYDDCGKIEEVDEYTRKDIIDMARIANSVNWDDRLKMEIGEYTANKPTQKQKNFADIIAKCIEVKDKPGRNATKRDYQKFISSHIEEYKKWREETDIANFACEDDYYSPNYGPEPEY